MNVAEYITSGILESYALGTVSDQERREVECLSSIYPDIRREIDELTEALEKYALAQSVEPPASVKEKLLQQLEFPASEPSIVRPMYPSEPLSGPTFRTTWLVAASVGLLLLVFSFYLFSQLRSNQEALASLRTANETLKAESHQLSDWQKQQDQMMALLRQPGTRTLVLQGNDKAPKGEVLVFWNANSRQVVVNASALPQLGPDQQYQLWSLVDGKPIDAGVFDVAQSGRVVQQLNRPIARSDAFAITVEKRGGNPTPTMATLLAMQPVNS
ncbi:anti-sigma factor domain-containing protein [Spirosoma sp. KUDC1026]|uniref:anti-sigma factor n=1 Tax=Spirosoma sp. KUDC1026 TaxID=2745947 RepID=UPI00159B9329|nr:anti-sigma factor [Spirosoma sp. KUDC1026]QKZ12520.1 anti-sigma factor [Spirosoma sp. KUDC1026]